MNMIKHSNCHSLYLNRVTHLHQLHTTHSLQAPNALLQSLCVCGGGGGGGRVGGGGGGGVGGWGGRGAE